MPPQEEESSGAGLDTKDPTSTENTIFHKRFQLPDTEVLIESKLPLHGRYELKELVLLRQIGF
jgi:hypothetical protein